MTTATRSNLDDLKRLFPLEEYFRRNGSTQDEQGRWRCPCSTRHTHGDAHHSVTISNGRARCWSQNCFGEKGADILQVVGVVEQLADFKSQKRRVQELAGVPVDGEQATRQILRRFRYRDGHGREAWKLRWNTDEPGRKCTWARDPDGHVNGKGDCDPLLYELERVVAVPRVVACEGERDANTLNAWFAELGLMEYVATTTPNGAGDVKTQFLQPLYGKAQVVLSGDNDTAGRNYAQKCGELLQGHVGDLRHVGVPDRFHDWTEWQESGAAAQDFRQLLDAAPRWVPDARSTPSDQTDAQAHGHRRPELDCDNKDLHALTTQAWGHIESVNIPPILFLYGDLAVRLEWDAMGRPHPRTLTSYLLRHEVARLLRCTKSKVSPFGGGVGRDDCKPSMDLVQNMLARPQPPLPALHRITEVPVFVPPGRLIQRPGYDHESSVFYAPYDPTISLAIPPNPTDQDVHAARQIIDELLQDFPFTGKPERTHAVALLLVYFVRDLIEGPIPAHLFEAPDAGTGKGLLATMVLYPAMGEIGLTSEPSDEAEWKKVITTLVVNGLPVFFLDNVVSALNGSSLKALLTADLWRDRLLGTNTNVCLPVRLIPVITANNVILGNEMARRVVRTRLDPKVDRPWMRGDFRHPNLKGWVKAQRPALIRAALILVQAWLHAGRPAPTTTPLGSYESWSHIVGGIVEFAGYEQFLGNVREFYETADSDGATWRTFVELWWATYQDQSVTVKDLFPIAESLDGLNLGRAANERGQRSTLGRQLKRRRDQVIGIYRIEDAGTSNNAALWRLQRLRTPEPESPCTPPSVAETPPPSAEEECDLYVD